MDFKDLKYLIVGSGFFGSVIAERIANDLNEKVVVIDKRPQVGGNCYSERDDETGIEYHKYGTHIFHTSDKKVWEYINRFTSFNGYRHQVLAMHNNRAYQMPINLETINSFYGVNLKPFEVDDFLSSEISKEKIADPQNLEEKAISLIGRPLYEAFIKGYTMKQWHKDPKLLPVSIIDRLPFRKNYEESYFFDYWQGMPLGGYAELFKRILEHKNIEVRLSVDYFDINGQIPDSCKVIYSGPIDRFFNYKYGKLEWRTLDFEREVVGVEDFQGTAVINYPELSVPYTRIHEPRHLHPERAYIKQKSLILREYSKWGTSDNGHYPVNTINNERIFAKYLEERKKSKDVIFGGRLADYKYYDMDKVIGLALEVYEGYIKKRGNE